MSSASSSTSRPTPLTHSPRGMCIVIDGSICIPAEVVDLDSFCRWMTSDQRPPQGRFSYLDGTIWVELGVVPPARPSIYRSGRVRGNGRKSSPSLIPPLASPKSKRRPLRVIIDESVWIPADVVDLDSFCRWATSDQYPERGRISYLDGTIWVDLSMEDMYAHNQVKAEFAGVLRRLTKSLGSGRFLPDGMLLHNNAANLSTVPDGIFVSYDALRGGRVRRLEGKTPAGYTQLDGSPEMVLEVVSESSVQKDTVDLRDLYWRAGILEYWLVDARAAKPRFDILRHGRKGYTATRKQAGGWVKSNVFGRSFQLTQTTDPLGDPLYTLNMRT